MAQPRAHSTPGCGGISMVRTPTSRMIAAPCSGPAPPKATSTKSRGSWPCSTDSSRVRPAMRWLTMVRIASAVCSTPRPSRSPSRPMAGARAVDVQPGQVLQPDRAVGVDAGQHGVHVRHGGLGAAAAEADRAGHRAGAARPDLQDAAAVEIGDGAAAGADRVHVDHRQAQRDAEVELGRARPRAACRRPPRRRRSWCRPCRR